MWDEGIMVLEDWMKKELTCPDIIPTISGETRAWRRVQEGIIRISSVSGGVNEAQDYQHKIGWYGADEG